MRLEACAAIVVLLGAIEYAPVYSEAANLDRTNLQYLLRGLLVHLDDPSAEIQLAVSETLRAAMAFDPVVVCAELSSVRERHRSSAPVDALLAEVRQLGELV